MSHKIEQSRETSFSHTISHRIRNQDDCHPKTQTANCVRYRTSPNRCRRFSRSTLFPFYRPRWANDRKNNDALYFNLINVINAYAWSYALRIGFAVIVAYCTTRSRPRCRNSAGNQLQSLQKKSSEQLGGATYRLSALSSELQVRCLSLRLCVHASRLDLSQRTAGSLPPRFDSIRRRSFT